MKTLNKILGIGLLAMSLVLAAPKLSKAQDGGDITDQEFYDGLQPYGTWVSDPQYGNVWVPDAEDNFRPYATRGHWVVTDYGNVWVSDYKWGWAPFHYGRWRYDDYYGWEWIPGHEWAPAWVSWRHGGGYFGWAPLMPGISISISIGRGYQVPDNYWVCAPQRYITRPDIYNYYARPSRSITIIHNTTIINNTYVNNNQTYIAGPRPQEIRQYTRQPVRVYNITNINNRTTINNIHNNTINIYRPAVRQEANARPARVVDANAYRQQNPNQAIAHRGTGGAPAFNHVNASRLAQVAKAPTPNNKFVRVNNPGNRNTQSAVTQQPQPDNHAKTQPQPNNRQQLQSEKQRVLKQNSNLPARQPARGANEQRKVQHQGQQRQQQLQQQKTQKQDQLNQAARDGQQAKERVQQQGQQRQQQLQQQKAQKQDQLNQAARDGQRQAQQKQQQAEQRQQQAQQKQQQAQQQEQQRQQQAQAQQKQQQAQQRQQQQAQQQAQQRQQQQQAQQRQQQQAQQRQQQQAQQRQQQQAQQQRQKQQQQQKAKDHPPTEQHQ